MFKEIKSWFKSFLMSEEEKYLSQSVDHCDLESRLKRLEKQRKKCDRGYY